MRISSHFHKIFVSVRFSSHFHKIFVKVSFFTRVSGITFTWISGFSAVPSAKPRASFESSPVVLYLPSISPAISPSSGSSVLPSCSPPLSRASPRTISRLSLSRLSASRRCRSCLQSPTAILGHPGKFIKEPWGNSTPPQLSDLLEGADDLPAAPFMKPASRCPQRKQCPLHLQKCRPAHSFRLAYLGLHISPCTVRPAHSF